MSEGLRHRVRLQEAAPERLPTPSAEQDHPTFPPLPTPRATNTPPEKPLLGKRYVCFSVLRCASWVCAGTVPMVCADDEYVLHGLVTPCTMHKSLRAPRVGELLAAASWLAGILSVLCTVHNLGTGRRSALSNKCVRYGALLVMVCAGLAGTAGLWWVSMYCVHYLSMMASWMSTEAVGWRKFIAAQEGGSRGFAWASVKSLARGVSNVLSITAAVIVGVDSGLGRACLLIAIINTMLNLVWRNTRTPAGSLAELLQKLLKAVLCEVPSVVIYCIILRMVRRVPSWNNIHVEGHAIEVFASAIGAALFELMLTGRACWDFWTRQRALEEDAMLAKDMAEALRNSDYAAAHKRLAESASREQQSGQRQAASASDVPLSGRAEGASAEGSGLRGAFLEVLESLRGNDKAGSGFAEQLGVVARPHSLQPRRSAGVPPGWKRGRHIGSGGFGDVYQGVRPDGTVFALKQLDLRRVGGSDAAKRLLKEVHVMQGLSHPHIVEYIDCQYDEIADRLMIFMEFVDGGSLGAFVRKLESALAETTAALYVRQVLLGIGYLHGKRIIHRDLKCDNLLLCAREGRVKVTDFGTSRNLGTVKGNLTAAIGTPLWMAPEVIRGGYTFAADVWSIGICTCELLNRGKTPWPEFEGSIQAVYEIAKWDKPLPPAVPSGLSADCMSFLRACLAPNAEDRLAVEDLLTHPFVAPAPASPAYPVSGSDTKSQERSICDVARAIDDSMQRKNSDYASGDAKNPAFGHTTMSVGSTMGLGVANGLDSLSNTAASMTMPPPTADMPLHVRQREAQQQDPQEFTDTGSHLPLTSTGSTPSPAPTPDGTLTPTPVVPDSSCIAFQFQDAANGRLLRFADSGNGSIMYWENDEPRKGFRKLASSKTGDYLKFEDIERGCALPLAGRAALLGKFAGLAIRCGVLMSTHDPDAEECTEGFPRVVDSL